MQYTCSCKLLLLVLVLLFLLLLLHQQVHLSGSQLLPKSIMGFSLPCIMSISQQLGLISRSPKSNYTPSLFKTHFLVRKSYIPASQAEPSPPIRSKLPSSSPDPDSPPPPPGPLSSCSCSSCSSAFLSCWFDLCSIHQARTSSSSSSAINPNVFFITFPTLDLLLNFQSTYNRAWKPTQRDTQTETERENQNAWGIFVFLV